MNQDLIAAVVGRIEAGIDKESIAEELLAAGYKEADIDPVYQAAIEQAQSGTDTPLPSSQSAGITDGTVTLPGYIALISDSLRFVFSRADLLLAALVVGGVLGLAEMVTQNPTILGLSDPFPGGLLLALLAWVIGVAHFSTVVYVTAHSTNETGPQYLDGLRWTSANIGSIIWIGILTTLIVATGFLLLIIPGIILSVYITLGYMVFAHTGTRGLSALLLSRHAVLGHWWGVWLRQLLIILVLFLLGLLLGFATGTIVALVGGMGSEIVLSVVVTVIMLIAGLISVRALSLIYHALKPKLANPEQILAAAPRTKYTILAWCGLVALPLLFIAVFYILALLALLFIFGFAAF